MSKMEQTKKKVETHCIVHRMTDWVNNAVFPTVLISAYKQIPEMISLPAKSLSV
jgi:hypothetical protein